MPKPKNPLIRLVHDNAAAKDNRPLYAGKTIVKRYSHQANEPYEISVPLVAWLAPKGEK